MVGLGQAPDTSDTGEATPALPRRKKLEDTAEGCRSMADGDRARAAATPTDHMRRTLERSADAWAARAALLGRLEASFNARAEDYVRDQPQRRASARKDVPNADGPIHAD